MWLVSLRLLSRFLILLPVVVNALSSMNNMDVSRRRLLVSTTSGSIALCLNIAFASTTIADTTATSSSASLVSRDQVAAMLHSIPTFTIVDSEGVPFMVVGEDAKVTGYFFIDYTEAQRILELAKTSADRAIREEKAEAKLEEQNNPSRLQVAATLTNPWNDARITVVPLDTAVSLALRTDKARNYFQVAASASNLQDAMDATKQEDLAEGKVPLFYYSDFEIPASTSDPFSRVAPVYFSKAQLEAEYRKRVPSAKDLPELQTTELFAVLTAMLTSDDPDLAKVRVMAPSDCLKFEQLCQKQKQPPFLMGKRNIVL